MKHLLLFPLLALALSACGKKSPAAHSGDHHDHDEAAESASFTGGRGISLIDETRRAIDLRLAPVEERELRPLLPVEVQVYRSASEASRSAVSSQSPAERSGFAYASAFIPPASAARLRPGDIASLRAPGGSSLEGTLWRIEPASGEALAHVEAIIEIPDSSASLPVGAFLSGSLAESGGARRVTAVPRSAILTTSSGTFAYVDNGGFLLRTPVSLGSGDDAFVEITDGLYPGDTVASSAVETLHLIELRATKGGGHSH